MHILSEVGLTFDDVLLVPRKNNIGSRFSNEINLSTKITPSIKLKLPIISANMDRVTEFEMANCLNNIGALGIIHRFMDRKEQANQISKLSSNRVICIGIGEDEKKRLDYILGYLDGKRTPAQTILIDIAHGYSQITIDMIRWIQNRYPFLHIIAGNVATYDGAAELISTGIDSIKIGVGPGCLAKGTRILMANGYYKNIEDIKLHDKVINKNGKVVQVIGTKFSGYKSTYKYRGNHFYCSTFVTGDHLHFCGDYSNNPGIIENGSLSKCLDKKEKTPGFPSKYKWSRIDDFDNKVALLPNNIEFEIKETFDIDLSKFAFSNRNWKELIDYKVIKPSYDLGYIFGLFLGDGTANIYKTKRITKEGKESKNTCGNLSWSFGKEERNIAQKLCDALLNVFGSFSNATIEEKENMILVKNRSNIVARMFKEFRKKQEKNLPNKYFCNNKEYLQGLLDGLIDSDGSSPEKGSVDYRTIFTNTSTTLIELYSVVFKIIYGYFPSISIKPPTTGNLKNCNIENCKESYSVKNVKDKKHLLTKDYQIVRIYSKIEKIELLVPTYDIEVDCSTNSFIANNVIVHNSLCSTRTSTGNGVPQLTAIIEAYKAKYPQTSIIADGGIKNSGDIIKALAAGADAVMIGSLFAGTKETPGNIISSLDGSQYKEYRGQASKSFQLDWKGKVKSIEGESKLVKFQNTSAIEVIEQLEMNMRSAMTYQDARNIKELQKNAIFIRQTQAGIIESTPHGIG